MAWIRPTIEHLKLVLAQEELDKLETASIDTDDVLQKQLDTIADLYRAAYISRGYTVDVRDHYIDQGYLIPVLNYARFLIFTRFPMTGDYALDENRKKQYEEAAELLKDPYIGVSKPDYSDDPDLSAMTMSLTDSAISMPWLKFPTMPFDTGFFKPYAIAIDKMEEGR